MAATWLKIATDFCDDHKIREIRRHPGGDTFIWLWLWVLTTAMKRETDVIYLASNVPYRPESIADYAGVGLEDVKKGFSLFASLGMIEMLDDGGISVLNFHKHQSVAQLQQKREMARIRKQKQREKEKTPQIDHNVTRDACDSHATEKRREEKSREEKNTNTVYSADFEAIWKEYPRHKEKKGAYKKYQATLKKGVAHSELLQYTKAYAMECRRNRTQEQFIKLPATFFGPNEPWRDYTKQEPEAIEPTPF